MPRRPQPSTVSQSLLGSDPARRVSWRYPASPTPPKALRARPDLLGAVAPRLRPCFYADGGNVAPRTKLSIVELGRPAHVSALPLPVRGGDVSTSHDFQRSKGLNAPWRRAARDQLRCSPAPLRAGSLGPKRHGVRTGPSATAPQIA